MARLDPLKKFSAGKIGSGKLFKPSSFSSRRRYGLAGALKRYKKAGKHSFAKNLDKDDLKTIHGVIGKEMSNRPTHSNMGYKGRRRAKHNIEMLRKQGILSSPDAKDAYKVIDAIDSDETSMPDSSRERAVEFRGSDKIAELGRPRTNLCRLKNASTCRPIAILNSVS